MSYTPPPHKQAFHNSRRTFAMFWMKLMHPYQIGITGSQGKTSTTKVVSMIAKHLGSTVTTDTNLDTNFNVPITALKVNPFTKYVVWELGIDHPGEMQKHLEIAHPDLAIITGISPVHTDKDHMGSLEILIKEKRKLIETLSSDGIALLNRDNPYVRDMASFTKAHVMWYGTTEDCDVWAESLSTDVTTEGTHMYFHSKDESLSILSPLIGTYHIYNLMAGYLVMKILLKKKQIAQEFQEVVSKVHPLRGRMNMEKGPLQTILLNDSLRANPESTKSGLETLVRMQYSIGRKIAVIGEMGELEHPEEEHKKTGDIIADLMPDMVLCIGPLRKFTIQQAILKGYPQDRIFYANDVFEAAEILKKILRPGDLWYLKGSLLRNYKRIIQLLIGEKVCCNAVLCPYEHCGYPE